MPTIPTAEALMPRLIAGEHVTERARAAPAPRRLPHLRRPLGRPAARRVRQGHRRHLDRPRRHRPAPAGGRPGAVRGALPRDLRRGADRRRPRRAQRPLARGQPRAVRDRRLQRGRTARAHLPGPHPSRRPRRRPAPGSARSSPARSRPIRWRSATSTRTGTPSGPSCRSRSCATSAARRCTSSPTSRTSRGPRPPSRRCARAGGCSTSPSRWPASGAGRGTWRTASPRGRCSSTSCTA